MAFISFIPDDMEITDNPKTEEIKLIDVGSYIGRIVEARNIVSTMGHADVFRITWSIDNDQKINKRFKLWDTDTKKRMWAQKDLLKLLNMLNVKTFNEGDHISYDTDALIGKENGLKIKHAMNDKNVPYAYVDTFYSNDEEKSTIPNDEIGF